MNTVTELDRPAALGKRAFEEALLEVIAPFGVEETRFYHLVARGRFPPSSMLRYAQATHRSAELFCATLSLLADQAPDSAARLMLLENLMEEEGIELRPGRGLLVRPQRRHGELAMRFVRACGGNRDDKAAGPLTPGMALLRQGRWTEAVAFLLVGQELKFAEASTKLFELLRKSGFADPDLAFFAVHGVVDREHGRQAIDLLLGRVRTREEQDRCVAAAGAGARHWFEMHGGKVRG